MKKLQIQCVRHAVQIIVLVLLGVGLYTSVIRPKTLWILGLALLAGNCFCGWVCPFGTVQEICSKIGSLFIEKKFKMPSSIQRYAQFSRYLVMLAVLLLAAQGVSGAMPFDAYRTFMGAIGGRAVQTAALAIMGGFLLISLFFERPYCNYACTEGIKFCLAGLARFATIKRNPKSCVNCKRCNQACPMNIKVAESGNLRNPQCINCFQCIAACPVPATLTYGRADLFGSRQPVSMSDE
jgi:polyferredoxin